MTQLTEIKNRCGTRCGVVDKGFAFGRRPACDGRRTDA